MNRETWSCYDITTIKNAKKCNLRASFSFEFGVPINSYLFSLSSPSFLLPSINHSLQDPTMLLPTAIAIAAAPLECEVEQKMILG